MVSRLPAICRLRATAPIRSSEVRSKPSGAGLTATGTMRSKVTVSLPSPPRLRLDSIRHLAASTSAIDSFPLSPCASTAMCLASLAKGTPRARPDNAPSALNVMRSFAPAGASVISPSGLTILACDNSQPASMVSASGTLIAKRPARRGAGPAIFFRNPGQRQAGFTQRPPQRRLPAAFLVAVDGLRIGQIGKYPLGGLRNNVLGFDHGVPRQALVVAMMGKRPKPDKH